MVGATTGGAAYSRLLEPRWLSVERVSLTLSNLPTAATGLKIVQMSDFHLHPYTQIDTIREAIAVVNDLRPDLVVLTGDFVLSRADAIFELAPVLAQVNPTHGIYACLGNHDLWTREQVVQQGLKAAGIEVLRNRGVPIGGAADWLYLAGLDDGWSGKPDLAQALSARRGDRPVILLAHEPDQADRIARDGRVALQLSGHSHGGQVRVPGIGALQLPYLGQKYDMGLYHIGDMRLYTNRGPGVIGPPVRFNCRPEITEITLTA